MTDSIFEWSLQITKLKDRKFANNNLLIVFFKF